MTVHRRNSFKTGLDSDSGGGGQLSSWLPLLLAAVPLRCRGFGCRAGGGAGPIVSQSLKSPLIGRLKGNNSVH